MGEKPRRPRGRPREAKKNELIDAGLIARADELFRSRRVHKFSPWAALVEAVREEKERHQLEGRTEIIARRLLERLGPYGGVKTIAGKVKRFSTRVSPFAHLAISRALLRKKEEQNMDLGMRSGEQQTSDPKKGKEQASDPRKEYETWITPGPDGDLKARLIEFAIDRAIARADEDADMERFKAHRDSKVEPDRAPHPLVRRDLPEHRGRTRRGRWIRKRPASA